MRDEHLGKFRLLEQRGQHRWLADPHDLAFRHRRRRRQPSYLSGEAAFAEKLVRADDGDHRLFALFGKDDDLDLTFYDLKYRVRETVLRKDLLIFSIFRNCPALALRL